MPSKAATAYNMKRLASIRHPANHSASTVPSQASPSERAIRLVFIETVNASPSKSPAVNARPALEKPAYDYRKCRDKGEVPASKPTPHAEAPAHRNLSESGKQAGRGGSTRY